MSVSLDFWTTRCTRCPAALDKLDKMAKDPRFNEVKFASINCDSESGARNIIEEFEVPKWLNVDHYHMDKEFKEKAKSELGFKSVPFLVVLNDRGEIVASGSPKQIDLEKVVAPTVVVEEEDKENVPPPKSNNIHVVTSVPRTFVMDEDF